MFVVIQCHLHNGISVSENVFVYLNVLSSEPSKRKASHTPLNADMKVNSIPHV